ncbi:MAG: lysophospholipase [Myxococcaceae bacterium]|nr:lysophospholipase [Myxococcaceae bacterium]
MLRTRRALASLLWMASVAGCSEPATPVDAATDAPTDAPVDVPALDAADDRGASPSPDATTDEVPRAADAGLAPLDYTSDALWLCRAGMTGDACLAADLAATEVRADGTRVAVPSPPAATDPAYDCFYLYPTVDVTGPAGNHTDLANTRPMLDPLLNQAARFREQCRVFAPLYRQSTLLGLNGAGGEAHLATAFRDVEAAFREYLRRDNLGRPIVLMGHSQGSFMAERLLTSVILPDAALRAKLVVALLVGGLVQVPTGAAVGGSLGAFPLCTSDDQTGCAIAYHTFGADHGPTPGGVYPSMMTAGREAACTNPAALASSATRTRVRSAYFPTFAYQAVFAAGISLTPAVTTPFVLFRDFYAVGCASNASLRSYLALTAQPAAGDLRADPIPYGALLYAPSFLGLHWLDYNVVQGDLQALVARKAARFVGGS